MFVDGCRRAVQRLVNVGADRARVDASGLRLRHECRLDPIAHPLRSISATALRAWRAR